MEGFLYERKGIIMRRGSLVFTAFLLIFSLLLSIPAAAAHYLDNSVTQVLSYLERQGEPVDQVIAARIAGEEPDQGAIRSLRNNAGQVAEDSTDIAGISNYILALTASGTDPRDCAGINLIDLLCTSSLLQNKSPRDLSLALIALNSGDFSPSAEGAMTPEEMVETLLSLQREDGGFGQTENAMSDPESTALAILALAPKGNEAVLAAAVEYLSGAIQADGSFLSTAGEETSTSLSTTVAALYAAGSSIQDERFVKEGRTLLDSLFSYQNEDNGFCRISGEKSDTTSSLWALYALESVRSGQAVLDFTDIELTPYQPSALKTYGSFILMTIGMIAIVYILLLLSRRLGRKIDAKRAKVKSDKIEKTDPDKNE